MSVARKVLVRIAPNNEVNKADLVNFINKIKSESSFRYNTNLYNETDYSSRKIKEVLPKYSDGSEEVNLVTASYVSDEIQKMNDAAISNNLIFLNEVGLDPGIDHMSVMCFSPLCSLFIKSIKLIGEFNFGL